MTELRLRLIYQEALQRIQDAETLSLAIPLREISDSPYLLRLLGMELLLKFVFESVLNKPATVYKHNYEDMFKDLPPDIQAALLSLAGERLGPSALVGNHDSVLREWGKNFIALRYPWERYRSLSEEQYANLGHEWVANGTPLEEATFRYYSEELFGFITALRQVAAEIVGRKSG